MNMVSIFVRVLLSSIAIFILSGIGIEIFEKESERAADVFRWIGRLIILVGVAAIIGIIWSLEC